MSEVRPWPFGYVLRAETGEFLCDDDGILHLTSNITFALTVQTFAEAETLLGGVVMLKYQESDPSVKLNVAKVDPSLLMASLLMDHGNDNDGTAFPFWYVASKAGLRAGHICHAGPFFSRRTATRTLRAKAHRFPKTAFVWCDSGHLSPEYRTLLGYAKAVLEMGGVLV